MQRPPPHASASSPPVADHDRVRERVRLRVRRLQAEALKRGLERRCVSRPAASPRGRALPAVSTGASEWPSSSVDGGSSDECPAAPPERVLFQVLGSLPESTTVTAHAHGGGGSLLRPGQRSSVWGPHFWCLLHGLPHWRRPPTLDQVDLLLLLQLLLTCLFCRQHLFEFFGVAIERLERYRTAAAEGALSAGRLERLVCEAHNHANRKTRKPEWSPERAAKEARRRAAREDVWVPSVLWALFFLAEHLPSPAAAAGTVPHLFRQVTRAWFLLVPRVLPEGHTLGRLLECWLTGSAAAPAPDWRSVTHRELVWQLHSYVRQPLLLSVPLPAESRHHETAQATLERLEHSHAGSREGEKEGGAAVPGSGATADNNSSDSNIHIHLGADAR